VARLLRRIWRFILVVIGVRKLSPGLFERPPRLSNLYHSTDTGGAPWPPTFRPQAPWEGGSEPVSDSDSKGEEHCWNQCTLCSGSIVYGWHVQGSNVKGGVFRHIQSDLDGGTDLYDLREAWDEYDGSELKIWSGQGWGKVREARSEWRAIVLQGTGNTPGAGTYTGAHAIAILPERPASGSEWLIGDPLCDGYDWVPESKLEEWAERFSSGVCFAVSSKHPPSAPPEPEPGPEPEPPPPPWTVPPLPAAITPAAVWMPHPMLWQSLRWSVSLWQDIFAPLWSPAWAAGGWGTQSWDTGRWEP
jgi:hypothetical protein